MLGCHRVSLDQLDNAQMGSQMNTYDLEDLMNMDIVIIRPGQESEAEDDLAVAAPLQHSLLLHDSRYTASTKHRTTAGGSHLRVLPDPHRYKCSSCSNSTFDGISDVERLNLIRFIDSQATNVATLQQHQPIPIWLYLIHPPVQLSHNNCGLLNSRNAFAVADVTKTNAD